MATILKTTNRKQRNQFSAVFNYCTAFLAIVLVSVLLPAIASAKNPWFGAFENPALIIVYSVSDDDAQIITKGGSEDPLTSIVIFGPRGVARNTARFKDGARLGQADFQFDSPEPSIDGLRAAYPPGKYHFWGQTVGSKILHNTVDLSYELLAPPEILYPGNSDIGIPINNLVVQFAPPDDAEAIRLEIEDEEEGRVIKVDLSGDASSFAVPNGWLEPGTEYVLDIKAIAENGNQTVRDIHFVTEE